jgi:Leucine-rich repeat (LRR) protein
MKKLYLVLIIFLFSNIIWAQDVPQIEREALMALYNATDGSNWTNNTNWGTAELVSTWYGVTVDQGRVVQLDLNGNNLNGPIPVEIGNLTKLILLKLSTNQLNGNIPAEIGNLTNLEWLWLHSTEISGTIPVEIGHLTSLRYLYLYSTKLSGAIPVEIGSLTNLRELIMYSNQLNGLIPIAIGDLVSLQSLNISNNQLSGNIPLEIGNLTNLQYLSLANNLLNGSIPNEIGRLTNLNYLDLHYNQLTSSIPSEIGQLSNLQTLWLAWNQLGGSIPPEIGQLGKLQHLWLDHNKFIGGIPGKMNQLTSLQSLYLQNNQLDSLSDLSTLDSLSLCHIYNNYFDFGDLETAGITAKYYYYSPQIQVEATKLEANGQITLVINVEGANNVYQWYNKDDYINGATDSTLTVSNAQDGAYWCSITNNNFPKLRLTSVVQAVGNSGVTHGIVDEEYDALISLYNNMDGEHWKDNTNWKSTEPVSKWHGVTVSDIHVKKINLSANELKGNIPKELGNLTHLKELYLGHNKLRGSIPAEIGKLVNLQAIILSSNDLKGVIPKEINQLSNLYTLAIDDNKFDELPGFTGLYSLRVQNNKLTFEDIEPNIILGNGFKYNPQSLVGNVKYYTPESGDVLSLNILIGGTANTYQWYKNDLAIAGATSSTYTISSYNAAVDSGIYVCKIKNSIASDLVLETRNYYVGVNLSTYNIVLDANPSIGGTVGSSDDYIDNEEVTVRAIANSGYHFLNWTENDTVVSLDADYTFKVESDRKLVANFEAAITGTMVIDLCEEIDVYPNPVQDVLKIRINQDMQNVNMSLFNMQGKQIYNQSYKNLFLGNVGQIDLSAFKRGMYILIIKADNELFKTMKIIKE